MSQKLLIADESVVIQKTFELILSEKDFTIDIISDGTEAFTTVKEKLPDIVFVDTELPGTNGYDLCSSIKKDLSLKNIQVFLLVAAAKGIDKKRAREAGADDYILKPFEAEELLSRIETAKSSKDIITQLRNELTRLRDKMEKTEKEAEKLKSDLTIRTDSVNVLEDDIARITGKLKELEEKADQSNKKLIEKILLKSIPAITDSIIREIVQGSFVNELKDVVEKSAEGKIPYAVERVITEELKKINKKIKNKK